MNKTVIGLLEESVGGRTKDQAKILHHDLDSLSGSWTKAEAAAFDKALAKQRGIDPDLWR